MPRIIAGEFRSRRLLAPQDEVATRPYPDRVKESVFNLLRGWFEDARVLDLFAGVGTMGLEAVSRGAAHVLMVEQNRKIHGLLEENIQRLGCGDRATAMQGDGLAQACLLRAPRPVDVVFIDPPYSMMQREPTRSRVMGQIERCREIMGESGFLVLRSPIDPARDQSQWAVRGFAGPESHRHGSEMWVLLYQPDAAAAEKARDAAGQRPKNEQ